MMDGYLGIIKNLCGRKSGRIDFAQPHFSIPDHEKKLIQWSSFREAFCLDASNTVSSPVVKVQKQRKVLTR